jgi:flagella basal body P-ring formation protein FlgA
MIRQLFAAAVFLAALAPASAQTVVTGDWVSLGDVAPVTGDAAKVLVGPAPPPGETLALDPGFIVAVAKRSGVILAIPLDQPIWVTRGGPVAPVAKSAPVAKTPPAAPLARQAASSSIAATGDVLVLVRDVARGARLAAADLDWQAPVPGRVVRGAPASMDLVVGMEMKRALKAGSPLQMSDVKTPALIRKGEPVKLVYASGGLRLTADGLAQGEAALGEPVRVLNNYSKRTVDAIATASGEASVLK